MSPTQIKILIDRRIASLRSASDADAVIEKSAEICGLSQEAILAFSRLLPSEQPSFRGVADALHGAMDILQARRHDLADEFDQPQLKRIDRIVEKTFQRANEIVEALSESPARVGIL